MTASGWGVAVGAALAAAWGLAGAAGLAAAWKRRVSLIVLMASAGLLARAVLSPPPAAIARVDVGIYGAAVAFASAGVLIAVRLLRGPQRRGRLAPAIALVIALHFVGLWAASGQKLFLGAALGLSAAALIALGWPRRPDGPDPRLAITGLGSALVLWAACVSSLV